MSSFSDDFQVMIEWAEEEGLPDFIEFVKHLRDAYNDKTPVIVEQDGIEAEIVICMDSIFDYKKPFPDIDIALFYKKNDKKNSLAMFKWDYTYMNKIKKIGDNKFHIISEESPEGTILFK